MMCIICGVFYTRDQWCKTIKKVGGGQSLITLNFSTFYSPTKQWRIS